MTAPSTRLGLALGLAAAVSLVCLGCGGAGGPDDSLLERSTVDGYIYVPRPGTGAVAGYVYVPRPGTGAQSVTRDEAGPLLSEDPAPPEGYAPAADVLVEILEQDVSTRTSSAGRFVLHSRVIGLVTVKAHPVGFTPVSARMDARSDVIVILPTPYPPEGFVPAVGVRVYLPGLAKAVVTDERGYFRFEDVPVGSHELEASGGPLGDHVWRFTMEVTKQDEDVHVEFVVIEIEVD